MDALHISFQNSLQIKGSSTLRFLLRYLRNSQSQFLQKPNWFYVGPPFHIFKRCVQKVKSHCQTVNRPLRGSRNAENEL